MSSNDNLDITIRTAVTHAQDFIDENWDENERMEIVAVMVKRGVWQADGTVEYVQDIHWDSRAI